MHNSSIKDTNKDGKSNPIKNAELPAEHFTKQFH